MTLYSDHPDATSSESDQPSAKSPRRLWLWALLALAAVAIYGLVQLANSLEQEQREYFPTGSAANPDNRFAMQGSSSGGMGTLDSNLPSSKNGQAGPLAPGARLPANHPPTRQAGALPDLAEKLQTRLIQRTPNDHAGWWLLGQTRLQLGQNSMAIQAFETARSIDDQPRYRMGLARALYRSGPDSSARASELVLAELARDPQQQEAVALAADIATDEGDLAQAQALRQRLPKPVQPSSPTVQPFQRTPAFDPSLAELNARIAALSAKPSSDKSSSTKAVSAQPANQTTVTASNPVQIQLSIVLSPELKDEVQTGDVLFVYAKAMNGPAFPLAAARFNADQLPLEVTLSDDQQVVPMAKLSDYARWKVGARISRSGQAMPQAGDLFAELNDVGPTANSGKGVELRIQDRWSF